MLTVKLHEEELEFLKSDTQHVIDHYEHQLRTYGDDPNNHLVHRWKAELLTRRAIMEKLSKAEAKNKTI